MNFKKIMEEKGRNWITGDIDEECISFLEDFAKYICDSKTVDKDGVTFYKAGHDAMTISQMRNIFGEIRRIQLNEGSEGWVSDFVLLKPKIAYASARVTQKSPKNRTSAFASVLTMAHGHVKGDWNNFKRFSQFVEGIVAYHKVYGGKN